MANGARRVLPRHTRRQKALVVIVLINSVETARLLLRAPELTDAETLMGILWDPMDLGAHADRSRHQSHRA
jgi:citrate lyase beta subunit